MSGAQFFVQAQGFSHPPTIKPLQRSPFAAVEWHRAKCPAPAGKCTGCAQPPKSD